MKNNIYLTGFSGTGKSTVGNVLASMMGKCFVDIDLIIEEKEGKSIPDIFMGDGEEYFRSVESECLRQTSARSEIIVSTGGGVPVSEKNIEIMENSGVVVWLKATPETILKRLTVQSQETGVNNDRPMLVSEQPIERIAKLLKSRQNAYQKSNLSVDTNGKNPETVAKEIYRSLSDWKQ
ncbi:shikimate kinase [Chloroflexi bacterium]|nr:shikimate kinase [Chloroflexota bacterium]